MCIIVNKPKGVEMPSKEILKNCFNHNKDGAGLMYALKNKVQIHKGFMDFDSFYDYLMKLGTMYDLKEHAIIMHFRISTGGNVDGGNCHPYPITKNEKALRKEHVTTDIGMAHNGIISLYNKKYGILNDTQQFILGCVSTLKDLNKDFLKDKAAVNLLATVAGSKLCFLDGDENVTMIGNFIEDDGVFYSNTNYKPYTNYGYWGYGSYYDYSNYRYYDEIVDNTKKNNQQKPLTEDEFYTCLENLVFLDKGDIIYSKHNARLEVKEDNLYALDTFFNLYYVNWDKHDIKLVWEDVSYKPNTTYALEQNTNKKENKGKKGE